jgi:hypothetical protein
MAAPLFWVDAVARQRGLRYEPDADERWLRAWEPYTTVKTPLRYEHALHATGGNGSLSIARAVVELPAPPAPPGYPPSPPMEVGTWIAIVQDERVTAKAAVTNDFGSAFAEVLDLVAAPRQATGDPAFDHVFASFAAGQEALAAAVTPSLRKLLLSWRVPVHAEVRPGGFVVAPVSVTADERGLSWLLDAIVVFGRKATKQPGP